MHVFQTHCCLPWTLKCCLASHCLQIQSFEGTFLTLVFFTSSNLSDHSQGPPGTGKTHTVKGILNVWHLLGYRRYQDCWRDSAATALESLYVSVEARLRTFKGYQVTNLADD